MERCGPYFLLEPLGPGSLTEAFVAVKAADGPSGKPVVFKRLHQQLEREPNFVRAFMDQAVLAMGLNHPGVARVMDAGNLPNPASALEQHFVVVEHVLGVPLNGMMNAMLRTSRTIPRPFAFGVVRRVLEVLSYAHQPQPGGKPSIIHGEVSPANVLITGEGTVKMTDFAYGRARGLLAGPEHAAIRGKLGYMAPEQGRGQGVDHRADLYAVGVMLFELLTCRRMRRGSNDAELLQQVQSGTWPSLESISIVTDAGLDLLLARALQENVNSRFQSAAEFLFELDAYVAAQDLALTTTQLGEMVTRLVPELPSRDAHLRALVAGAFTAAAASPPPAEAPAPSPPSEASAPPAEVSAPRPRKPGFEQQGRARIQRMVGSGIVLVAVLGLGFWSLRGVLERKGTLGRSAQVEPTRDLSRLVGGRTVLFWSERVHSLDNAIAKASQTGGADSPEVQQLKAQREDTLRKAKALGLTDLAATSPAPTQEK